MHLQPGRVREMLDQCARDDSVIPCHSTTNTGKEAICRGFFDHPGQPNPSALQIAERLGFIEWIEPPDWP